MRSCGTYAHRVRSGSSKGNEAAARCEAFSVERNVRGHRHRRCVEAGPPPHPGAVGRPAERNGETAGTELPTEPDDVYSPESRQRHRSDGGALLRRSWSMQISPVTVCCCCNALTLRLSRAQYARSPPWRYISNLLAKVWPRRRSIGAHECDRLAGGVDTLSSATVTAASRPSATARPRAFAATAGVPRSPYARYLISRLPFPRILACLPSSIPSG